MRNLTQIGTQCERELEAIGIKCGFVTQYTVNTRATGRKGLCSGNARSGYVIDIAEILKSVQIMLDQREKNAKYRYVCENCGKEHVQQRASYFTRHPEAYSCGRCKTLGRWKRIV